MTKRISSLLLALLATGFMLVFPTGCIKDKTTATHTVTYTIMAPVLKAKADVLAAINGNPSEAVQQAGKIYIKGKFIYLNEVDKGIHIIDNSDPSKPSQVAFLNIPGNRDIAVKGNTLYADMYSDLLAIDISNPKKVSVTNRIANFFMTKMYIYGYGSAINDEYIAVDWIKKDTVIAYTDRYYEAGGDMMALNNAGFAAALPGANGTAGSMASMVLMNDYLYAIREPHSVGIVDITVAATPRLDTTFYAGFDLETIYPFEDKLFLGSSTGMFMYDLANPTFPVQLGTFSHGRACDPVVTDGEYAYVTLRGGSSCGGNNNELNIVDVKDLMNPVLVKTYLLTGPTGLSKDGNLLFVCDGTSGVRLYDASDPGALKQLQQIESDEPYDVIAANKKAMIVGKNGLYQYDYSNLNNIRLLSFYSLKQ
ncbi:hypothetical protein [Agriterribacter sp.]|uniref:LVIVD repeat-containing protein n=1 Tax=Agriterribacter sp. TaxID=2821509 RepID=UPI002CAC7ECD|nr:hypothetical protein [Agriterribacter sp.]HRO45016.1 hypothetical protein [Agriterribacter sp.]HRQ15543.1 hypothetical protein [Agriterribacter sp.]